MLEDIGLTIRVGRAKKKISQSELAKRLGVSRIIVGKWENNQVRPSFEHLVALTHELDIKEF